MAKISNVSPLAPKGGFPDLPSVRGVEFATVEAGIRYKGRDDVMLARLSPGSAVAGVFTRSSTRAAPVLDCQKKIGVPSMDGAAFIVNSGNANAFTGRHGDETVETVTTAVAHALDISVNRVYSSSTGVIGEPLPGERIVAAIDQLKSSLSEDNIKPAAKAIMTTDTYAKGASAVIDTPEGSITITGIAKGSGMIAPDMATMLAYIFTDAKIDQSVLQATLAELTDTTFNSITVDSDTSTSDTLLIGATGHGPLVTTENITPFRDALNGVMLDLAHQVVRDGEGATKFVEVSITGALTQADARKVALAVANSPLVKTAIAGEDPNWGRVVMAVGKSGAVADRDLLSISFGDVLVAEKGWVSPDYREEDGAAYMKAQDLVLHIDMGLGTSSATVWTCDLTHGYIQINTDYRS
ncbi:MAG: bifunctional glutamate N-acetyltransferase/amino-acid acetyltransferase ArgJ [Pseudoruegeria sp.]